MRRANKRLIAATALGVLGGCAGAFAADGNPHLNGAVGACVGFLVLFVLTLGI
jgi:hypothetical protein